MVIGDIPDEDDCTKYYSCEDENLIGTHTCPNQQIFVVNGCVGGEDCEMLSTTTTTEEGNLSNPCSNTSLGEKKML